MAIISDKKYTVILKYACQPNSDDSVLIRNKT